MLKVSRRRSSLVLFAPVLALLCACEEAPKQDVLTMDVKVSPFAIDIPAKGELIAATETSITSPQSKSGQLVLAWLQEENRRVEKGEVIARFDGEENRLARDDAQLELEKSQLQAGVTERDLEASKFSIDRQSEVVRDEMSVAERFAVDDLQVYSKNEIIDQMLSLEYLQAKEAYLDWSRGSQTDKAGAQLSLLQLQSQAHEQTIALHEAALAQLEVRAPHGGILVYAKNWRGEKIREGLSLWPGSKIAAIPNLDKMQARLYVLEGEAAGLAIGQRVEVVLDAYPEKILQGEVLKVASIATPREHKSPIKYFESTVSLNVADASFMRPGQKVSARIVVAESKDVISVPNQAIFRDEGRSWVYLKRGDEFVMADVELGQRSLTRAEVLSGLRAGDEIALSLPPANGPAGTMAVGL